MSDNFIYQPPESPIEILYQDKDVLVAHKPSGLLSVPGRTKERADSMLFRLQKLEPRTRVVHRLDMDTSGVMIFALRKKAEINLREQFRKREVSKEYRAVVEGLIEQKEGVIDAPIAPHPKQKLRHYVSEKGKPSRTRYWVIEEGDDCSLIGLQPITGRSHQLRVHLHHIGHPILGDRFYAPLEVVRRTDRLMLHAETIVFKQPYSGEELAFVVPASFLVV